MGVEMNGHGAEENTAFEIAIVVPKKRHREENDIDGTRDCVKFLVKELERVGFIVETVQGIFDQFIKLAAPMETLGRAAAELQIKKLTYVGVDLPFEWDQVTAFVRQPDGSLFSWCERYSCFRHLIYEIVNETKAELTLSFDGKEFKFQRTESLIKRLESEGIIRQIFPMHDEIKRKRLLGSWALNWLDFTWQPIDEIYSYFGTKIATYFAFLAMYTRWLFFPATFGLALHMIDFGPLQLLVLPAFFIFVVSWAVFFFQFWKRKNSALLARWGIDSEINNFGQSHWEPEKNVDSDKPMEKKLLQRAEWLGLLLKIRNNAIIVVAIICLQLPFELAYAHLYEIIESDVLKYALTAVYLLAIQYYTKIGGKVSVVLIRYENNQGEESSADSLIYKVLENFLENSIPYIKYSYKKYKALHKKKHEKGSSVGKSIQLSTRVEKEYLKPSYSASIGEELEDGLFDDFLEVALQFGMIMMFACAFPLLFCFAALNNVTEIRTDALKLLVMLKRPIPRAAATIGAWLNIFQILIVMAICTNCVLLVCLYDQEGKWRIEPGLAAIFVMEHILLLIKFGFSHFVPEEPAWVKANRVRNVARDAYSKQLLRSISSLERKRV